MNYYYITVKILDNNFIFNTYNHLEEAEIIFDKLCDMMNPPQVFSIEEFGMVLDLLECKELDHQPMAMKGFNNGFIDISIHEA